MIHCADPNELRDTAEMREALDTVVTVEMSLPLLWIVRDLVGLGHLTDRVGMPMQADLERLSAALPRPRYRVDDRPHVSRWAKRHVQRLVDRWDNR